MESRSLLKDLYPTPIQEGAKVIIRQSNRQLVIDALIPILDNFSALTKRLERIIVFDFDSFDRAFFAKALIKIA